MRFPFDLRLSTDLRHFYAAVTLRHFGLALITLFVPAFLYKELGFSIHEILLYFLLQESLNALFGLFVGRFIARYGARASMLASVPFSLMGYWFLPLARNPSCLFLSALGNGAFSSFYYVAFHTYLARSSQEKKVGEALGKTWSWFYLAVLAGPLAGGILLEFAGYSFVYAALVVLQLVSVSLLPSLKHRERPVSYLAVFRKVPLREKISWFSQGVHIQARHSVWPLYAFLILQGYAFFGGLQFLAGIAVAAFSFWLGKRSESVSRPLMSFWAWVSGVVAWAWRSLVVEPFGVLVGNAFGEMAFLTMENAVVPSIYAEGKRTGDLVSRIVVREIVLRFGLLPLLVLVWLLPLHYVFAVLALFFAALAWVYRV